ncbi:hypothetical protein [Sphingobacterium sp. SYP-B4668]|uniref:hypothetical protein n=1 Tax=Sphingobacterium sp. SYP-B4668 TaxID=2996035 RepID=UPI0022DDE6F8|nr:hypothetical protein [Sphingobacterium sp. SYP-B4668]
MGKTKDDNRTIPSTYIGIFSILFMFLYSSCGSISPKYLIGTADQYNTTKIASKQVYVFENFPQKIENLVNTDLKISSRYNGDCLWNFIEPGYYKRDSLQYLYKVSLELKSKRKIHFKLIDTMGNVVREKAKRIKSEPKDFLSIRNTNVDIYILINRFFTKTACFAIDINGDLIVPNEFVAGGFLVFFPLAAGQGFETNTYRRVDTPSIPL